MTSPEPDPQTLDDRAAALLAAKVTAFWSQVDQTAGPTACWPWTGYCGKDGYGHTRWRGRAIGTHELAVTLTTGEIRAPHLDTCHSCDNRICCNPRHLRFDSRQSNVDDAVARQRNARGSSNGTSKLSELDVIDIRNRAAHGATGAALAAHYQVSPSLITEIIRGRRWKHVGGPIRTQHGNRKKAS